MRNAALGDGEGNVHASHNGEGGSDHHRPEAIHRHPRKVSKNHRSGAIPETPLGRPGQPAEIAPLYVTLAFAEASYSSGQVFGVSGGKGAD